MGPPPETPSASYSLFPGGSSKSNQDRRRASMVFVDFMTEDGISVSGGSGDEGFPRRESREFSSSANDRRNSELSRKLYFGKGTGGATAGVSSAGTDDEFQEENVNTSRNDSQSEEESIPVIVQKNVDDIIFEHFRENDDTVHVGYFLSALEQSGLRRNDPRLTELYSSLKEYASKAGMSGSTAATFDFVNLFLTRDEFLDVIKDNIVLISRAFRRQLVFPDFTNFSSGMKEIYEYFKGETSGKVATSIPQLERANPKLWGVSVCSIDGQRASFGDTLVPFTIQSCSKPLLYAIALNELGAKTVHEYVGQEPSGRSFNELILDHNKQPHNPMVNAGSIVVSSLIGSLVKAGMRPAEIFDSLQEKFKKLCGGEYIGFNNSVYLSERATGDRNHALGFLMREHNCFPPGVNLQEVMDLYFQICSIECNVDSMSVMAATLSNGGICPINGEKVLESDTIRHVLSLMYSCGMYDESGQFAFRVGLPAKSGVCGAVMVVIPNVCGVVTWSPPLNAFGNSCRGVGFLKKMVRVFNFEDTPRYTCAKLNPVRGHFETKGLNIVNLLFSAAAGDKTSIIAYHLAGMDMNSSDYDGRTALHLAAAEGHLECVVYLLRKCQVNHTPFDRWGYTPFNDAERFGQKDVADFLQKWVPITV